MLFFPFRMGRIWVALVCALGLAAIIGGANALFRVKAVPKGWRAPYTMRAPSDLAWNQRETRAAEVRGFVPIYDQPPGLLEQRRRAILDEVDQLQVAYWRYPADGPEGGAELAFLPELPLFLDTEAERTAGPAQLDTRSELTLHHDWLSLQLSLRCAPATTWWRFPLLAASQSEGGFERTYQGTVFAPLFRHTLAPGAAFEPELELEIRDA